MPTLPMIWIKAIATLVELIENSTNESTESISAIALRENHTSIQQRPLS
jgi:hypothetical protein